MKERILTFYNNNKRKVLLVLIVLIVLIALPKALRFFVDATEKPTTDLGVINESTIQNNLNTSVVEADESVLSGEKLYASQETFIELIDNFVDACNNGNIEQAYQFLSTDCKEELYPNIEGFQNNYYNQIFKNGRKMALIENWINNIYKVNYSNNILATGSYNEEENIQDYITVVDDNGETKLNINSYIGKVDVNKNVNYMDIQVNVVSKKVYMDYETYMFEIKNNSANSILLDNQQNIETMYIEDEVENKYEAYVHELTSSMLTVPAGTTRNINIKYYNKYSTNKIIQKVVFSKVILNNDWYSTLENKSVYDYYGIIEIGL